MARTTFFSFHYQRDIFRVNQIRSIPNVTGVAAAGFNDASLWEEAKKKGDATIKAMIDKALIGTSVTVVFCGMETANRKYVDYEIEKSLERGNAVIAVKINHLKNHLQQSDPYATVPKRITDNNLLVYTYTNVADLAKWIEAAAIAKGK